MALTARVWAPLTVEKVSQVAAKGAAVSLATTAPSKRNSMLAVPGGAAAESSREPDTIAPFVSPVSDGVDGGVGGTGSTGGGADVPGVPPAQARAAAARMTDSGRRTGDWRNERRCTGYSSRWTDVRTQRGHRVFAEAGRTSVHPSKRPAAGQGIRSMWRSR